MVGIMQANEVLKYILNAKNPLIGKLLFLNVLDYTFRQVKIYKDPNCKTCGELRNASKS
jgi:adenylyltransferase/sulfurtransferase